VADLELPMPLDLPKVEETSPKLGKGHAEVDRAVTDELPVTVPQQNVSERDINNLVTEMAAIMHRSAVAEGDAFLEQVAVNLSLVGEAHSQGEYHGGSVCQECGMGDTAWPCWHWLQAVYTGVEWLYRQAGIQRPVRP
jgi:hypothetical protein